MNSLEIINKVESIIFQLCIWLFLYPKTLFYTLFKPKESLIIALKEEKQSVLLSPRIFWAITILYIGYLLYQKPLPSSFPSIFSKFIRDAQSMIAMVVIIWSVVPGAFSVIACKEKWNVIDIEKLEPFFDAQCYLTAVFGIGFWGSFIIQIYELPNLFGRMLMFGSIVWFCVTEIIFFMIATKAKVFRAFLLLVAGFGLWTAINYFWLLLPTLLMLIS